jgi:hypothetical protein
LFELFENTKQTNIKAMITNLKRAVMFLKISNATQCKNCKYTCKINNMKDCFFYAKPSYKTMTQMFRDSKSSAEMIKNVKRSYTKRSYSTTSDKQKGKDKIAIIDTTMYGLGICSIIIVTDVVIINMITKVFYYFW